MSPQVTVVIPYFQREPGILRTALESALTQAGVARPHILVVDDSSPAPADDEINALPQHLRGHVTLIRQPNAGPAAARNRGLDAVPANTDFVALLDSDDQWLPEHLARALHALGSGNDFYFANYFDIGQTEDGFTQRGILRDARGNPIAGLDEAYTYRDDLRLQILDQGAIETSTVVFRWSTLNDLRFRADFRDAYEDLMFWFEAAGRTDRIAFSWRPETQYGKGINLFRSSTWGTDAALKRIVASTRFRSEVRRRCALNPRQLTVVKSRLATNRREFAAQILNRIRTGKPMLWDPMRRQFRADPLTALTLIPECARLVLRRLLRRGQPSTTT